MSKILITGCGRSATLYTSVLLQKLGLDIQHEKMGENGTVNWYQAAEPYYGELGENPIIVHQVRHPLRTIASCQRWVHILAGHPFIEAPPNLFLSEYIPIDQDDSLLYKSMTYWYYWNKLAEQNARYTYRIENLPNVFEEFCQVIGYPELAERTDVFDTIPKNINTNPIGYNENTWDDLYIEDAGLTDMIINLAVGYGYKI